MNAELWITLIIGGAATVEDLARRTISNWLPLAALAGGIACQASENGWRGAGSATIGAVSGFGIFLIFYLLGGMGGGDVKLMAGFGSLLGVGRLLQAAFWTAICGGLLAAVVIGVAAFRRKLGKKQEASPRFIPYAPAIALGVWLTLISRP